MSDSPAGLPLGEDQDLDIQGSVTVCDGDVEDETREQSTFNDQLFYCESCQKAYKDQCEVHGPPLFTHDSPTPVGVPQRALLTLPQGLVIGRSMSPGAALGVFNQGQVIPAGMHFGPLDGELASKDRALESPYSWVTCQGEGQYVYIDAERDTHSNWMRYVVSSLSEKEQNLVAFQQSGRVLFRCCRPVLPGQELRVWYAEEYAQSLGSTWDQIWDRKCANTGKGDEDRQVFICPYCHFSFPTAFYLHRHVRRSHPEYPPLSDAPEPAEPTQVLDLDQCLLAADAPSSSQTQPESLQSQLPLSGQSEPDTDEVSRMDSDSLSNMAPPENECIECRRTFLRSCHLKRHQRTIHSKEKPYCCSRCRKCFSQATGLKRHQQTHQGETDETTDSQAAGKEDAPSEFYPCTECSFSFVAKLHLFKHLKRHHHGEYLKLLENHALEGQTPLHSEDTDKHDPLYEPPARLRRHEVTPKGGRGLSKKGLSGRPRGRPPKNKNAQQPVKSDAQEPSQSREPQPTLESVVDPPGADGPETQEPPSSSHVCGECLRTFSHLHLLKSHECIQQGDGPHGCSHCGLYFNRLCNLRRHERTVHAKERPYCCTLCLKSFTQYSGLKRHQESHSRRRAQRQSATLADAAVYPCSHCPFSFTAERYLHKHVRRHHPETTTKYLGFGEGGVAARDHSCSQCSKVFRTIRGFKNHACFRQGDQLYLCPDCGKAFSWFNSLKQHQRIHTGIKPHACPQCQKSFVHSGQLNVHMRTHTGEKPFLCAECGESFRQSGDLRRHEQKHSGVRPCQCPDCGKSFSRPQSLRAHQQLHRGTKLFPCTQCGKSFARRYHLTRHHQKMHS